MYEKMESALKAALGDLSILCGDDIGPSDVTWRDVAGTAACNLRVLASYIEDVREGKGGPFPSFPSPTDWTLDT